MINITNRIYSLSSPNPKIKTFFTTHKTTAFFLISENDNILYRVVISKSQ